MFFMAIGMLLASPLLSHAQGGYTDEDIDFEGSDASNTGFGPTSLEPEIIHATISHINKTITLSFLEDLGTVTIWIVDEKGNLYISEEVDTVAEATKAIDMKSLQAQKYTIICFTPEGQQKGKFELHK